MRPIPDEHRPADVVRFWRAVELFSAQDVPKRDPSHGIEDVRVGTPLPWESEHRSRRMPLSSGRRYRYTVYCNLFSMERLCEILDSVLGNGDGANDERSGTTAMLAFLGTEDGCPLIDTLVVSSCAWALGKVLHSGADALGQLDGFEKAQSHVRQRVEEWIAGRDQPSAPLALDELLALSGLAATELGIDGRLGNNDIRIRTAVVPRTKAEENEEVDFLNSFLADDLRSVETAMRGGDFGAALGRYLASDEQIDPGLRVDVRQGLSHLFTLSAPDRIPAGRWPAPAGQRLALGQQVAVNTVLGSGSGSPISGINGPPGTGKTTMLRDLVAALIVERARRISELAHPRDAFTSRTRRWLTDDDYHRVSHDLRLSLTGFEMVVASSNNAAVEIVTKEIPQSAAIDAEWANGVAYFEEIARRLTGLESWALLAAALGKRENCHSFIDRFWYRDASGDTPGIADLLREAEGVAVDWPASVKAFRAASSRVETLRNERQQVYEALQQQSVLRDAMAAAHQRMTDCGRADRVAQDRVRSADIDVADAEHRRSSAVERRDAHRRSRPGLLQTILSLGRDLQSWRQRDAEYEGVVHAAEAEADAASVRRAGARRDAVSAGHALNEAHKEYGALVAQRDVNRRVIDEGLARWGSCVPLDWWWRDEARREREAPWLDDEWNRARTRLFLAALDLHSNLIRGAAKEFRQNLTVAMDILQSNVPRHAPRAGLRAAWQALFLVVPVMSTTFASFGRLFAHLGSEELGWLFVDEAGQAAPQAAVGAIWRSAKVVVVGDPLQLEPITSLPAGVQTQLATHFDVSDNWAPSAASVQQLADRVTAVGTSLHSGNNDAQWVGMPLRVHRRCDEPMFSVFNEIAYDNLMFHGVAHRAEFPAAETAWIDVSGGAAAGHWIHDEWLATAHLLEQLTVAGIPGQDIIVIAPFRKIAAELAARVRGFPGVRSGTVHTAQGKEADVLILILGGDPGRPGALRWASKKVNLINVAISRPRRRLYVVGDRTRWARQPHFKQLAAAIGHSPWGKA